MSTILIFNARLIDQNTDCYGSVLISNGKIAEVFNTKCETLSKAKELVKNLPQCEFYDAKALCLSPAFIDMHVHYRFPGQTQKEDLNTGLRSSCAGGFGTVVAMPNTNPVISSTELAKDVMKQAKDLDLINMFQTVSITKDFKGEDISHLNELNSKEFPVITEDGHDVLNTSTMLDAMKIAASKNIIVSCHSEDPNLALKAKPYRIKALEIMKECNLSAWGSNSDDLSKIPEDKIKEIDSLLTNTNDILALAEDSATFRNILSAQKAGCHVHIAHCSTKISLEAVRMAKANMLGSAKGFKVSCEVTPHHLALTGDCEPTIRALVNPPLRTEEDRQAVIQALKDGTADVISTDHAPHTLEDKAAGAPGFTGEETAFAVCNSVLVKENGFSLSQLSKLMSANGAKLLKLNKGLIQEGYDADLNLFDPDEEWTVEASKFYSKGKASPFEGKKLTGKIHSLFINGKEVFKI